jgi:hypothetical protein
VKGRAGSLIDARRKSAGEVLLEHFHGRVEFFADAAKAITEQAVQGV